jgi:hypothetical protein
MTQVDELVQRVAQLVATHTTGDGDGSAHAFLTHLGAMNVTTAANLDAELVTLAFQRHLFQLLQDQKQDGDPLPDQARAHAQSQQKEARIFRLIDLAIELGEASVPSQSATAPTSGAATPIASRPSTPGPAVPDPINSESAGQSASSLITTTPSGATTSKALVNPALPYILLEDMLDIVTHHPSPESLFTHVEERLARAFANITTSAAATPKGVTLLRTGTTLLRRLSANAREAQFAGRVLGLLANAFPLHDRSGVNLRGECNTSNRTTWDDVDGQPAAPSANANNESDAQVYKDFWALQNELIALPLDRLPAFLDHVQRVVGYLETFPIARNSGPSDASSAQVSKGGEKRAFTSLSHQRSFFPKYLTGFNIFNLEVRC